MRRGLIPPHNVRGMKTPSGRTMQFEYAVSPGSSQGSQSVQSETPALKCNTKNNKEESYAPGSHATAQCPGDEDPVGTKSNIRPGLMLPHNV